jgi:hypothetical protein
MGSARRDHAVVRIIRRFQTGNDPINGRAPDHLCVYVQTAARAASQAGVRGHLFMKATPSKLFYIVIGFTLGQFLIATPVKAEVDCQLLLDAASKVFVIPAHLYLTTTTGGKTTSMEEIYAAGAIYVKIDGKWSPSPITMQEMKEMNQKNIHDNKTTCGYLRDELANGEAAAVYSVHNEGPRSKSDGQTWISKAKGWPLRSESDVNVKTHISMRYEYGNVKPPM